MTEFEPKSKPASRRRSTILSIAFLVFIAVVVWAFDGVLLFKLRMYANEAYAERNYPMLSVDAVDELSEYSPKRLAKFLSFPSTQVQGAACMAIGTRRDLLDPAAWVGVGPALLKAHRNSVDPYLRLRLAHVIELMPFFPEEDREFVFELSKELLAAERNDPTGVGSALSVIAAVDQRERKRVLAEMAAWFPKASHKHREELLNRVLLIDPESADAAEAIRWAFRDEPYYHLPNVKKAFEKHESLLDELMDGTRSQRLTATMLTCSTFGVVWQCGNHWGDVEFAKLPSSQRDRLKRTALDFLERDSDMTPNEFAAAFGCLAQLPDGPKTLLEHAKRTTGKRRAYALSAATAGVRDAARRESSSQEGEELLRSYLKDALAWLAEDDPVVHEAVFRLIHEYPSDSTWFKMEKTGLDAPIVEACRRFLDKRNDLHDYTCLTILARATPKIDLRDADRIATALERALLAMKSNYERTGIRPQGSIDAIHEILFTRLKKYAERSPAKKALQLRQQLLDEGIITKPRAR